MDEILHQRGEGSESVNMSCSSSCGSCTIFSTHGLGEWFFGHNVHAQRSQVTGVEAVADHHCVLLSN